MLKILMNTVTAAADIKDPLTPQENKIQLDETRILSTEKTFLYVTRVMYNQRI